MVWLKGKKMNCKSSSIFKAISWTNIPNIPIRTAGSLEGIWGKKGKTSSRTSPVSYTHLDVYNRQENM